MDLTGLLDPTDFADLADSGSSPALLTKPPIFILTTTTNDKPTMPIRLGSHFKMITDEQKIDRGNLAKLSENVMTIADEQIIDRETTRGVRKQLGSHPGQIEDLHQHTVLMLKEVVVEFNTALDEKFSNFRDAKSSPDQQSSLYLAHCCS